MIHQVTASIVIPPFNKLLWCLLLLLLLSLLLLLCMYWSVLYCIVLGITNTTGRILAGFLADLKRVNALLLHNMALVLAGLLCFADMFCREFATMCLFSALFGLCIGQ